MRLFSYILIVTLVLVLASCGNKGGRFVTTGGDYPTMYGTYIYSFHATGDANNVVGVLINEDTVQQFSTTTNGQDILAYDGFGRVYEGTFTTPEGAFTITTSDPWQHQVTTITLTGRRGHLHDDLRERIRER
jgi:hypothetical protein